MSRELIGDINRCMRNIDVIDTRMATANFIFDKDFLGFQGHFENNPVLPGVCKILSAVEVIKKWKGKDDLELKEIKLAKFFRPITCDEELIFKCLENENLENFSVKVSIAKEEEKVAELKLIF
ncbi:MAG: hypothetical protein P9M07_05820 [Candidatus Aceula meridiana]|nr:hypothetical protein [Candidatus Aceula meridiana]